MLLKKYDIINCSLSEYLDNLEEHLSQKRFREKFVDFITLGLEFLLTFPDAKNISFFSLNEESFNFDFITSIPDMNAVLCEDLYQSLVDSGKIGESIDSEKYLYVKKNNENILESSFIIPVFKKNGLIGIILFILNDNHLKYDKNLTDKISIFFRFYSLFLENIIISREFTKTKALLEQRVAVRTKDLVHSKRELQAILNSVNTAILVVDPENEIIIHANTIASQLLDRDFDQIVGHSFNDFLEPISTGSSIIENPILLTGTPSNIASTDEHTVFSSSYESKLLVKNSSLPILRATSHIKIGLQKMRIESFVDISVRKKIELELKRSNEVLEQKIQDRTEDLQIMVHKLKSEVEERIRVEDEVRKMLEKEKELNELKSRFISMVSHEFRTPLTIINSAAQILQKYRNKINVIDQNLYLARIMQTVDQMASLLENVIFIGRSDVNMLKYDPSSINVIELAKSVINDIMMGLDNKRTIKFNVNLPGLNVETGISGDPLTAGTLLDNVLPINTIPQLSVELYAKLDEKLLRHILLNLFTNAIKYSPEDTEIIFNILQEKNILIFEITDFGIGIPEEDIPMIFDQFYRAANVGNISGTGLGMSVITKSLEMMNGTIEVHSELGKGTTFKILIPDIQQRNESY